MSIAENYHRIAIDKTSKRSHEQGNKKAHR